MHITLGYKKVTLKSAGHIHHYLYCKIFHLSNAYDSGIQKCKLKVRRINIHRYLYCKIFHWPNAFDSGIQKNNLKFSRINILLSQWLCLFSFFRGSLILNKSFDITFWINKKKAIILSNSHTTLLNFLLLHWNIWGSSKAAFNSNVDPCLLWIALFPGLLWVPESCEPEHQLIPSITQAWVRPRTRPLHRRGSYLEPIRLLQHPEDEDENPQIWPSRS